MLFISRDINTDLLNENNPNETEDFIRTTYSMDLYPKINKHSGIITHSATLIDDTFSNYIMNNTLSGLLGEISDYLPVFIIYCYKQMKSKQVSKCHVW